MSTVTPFDPQVRQHGHTPVPGDIGQGVLGKFTKFIYWYLVLTVLLVIATLPAIALLLLITPEPQTYIFTYLLIALAMIPIGPAISAGIYAVRARFRSEDKGPFRAFWRGYKTNFLSVLKVWVPALLVLGIIGFTLAFGGFIGLTMAYRIGLSVVGLLILAWAVHAIAITTFFHLRFQDVARLAVHYMFKMPRVTFGVFALAIILGAVGWFVSFSVPAILLGILAWFLYQNERTMLNDIYRQYTTPSDQEAFTRNEILATSVPSDHK